jgi:hypothetical protein
MPTLCTASGDPIRTGDAVCLVGFDPFKYPFRPAIVAKATPATLSLARSILGIADAGHVPATHGEPVDVLVGGDGFVTRRAIREAGRRRGTLVLDVSAMNPAELVGVTAEHDTVKLVGDLTEDVHVVVPQKDGWSARFLDHTTNLLSDTCAVRITADVNGTTVTTTRGATQRVYVELDGRNFNVRAEAPAI